MTSLEKIISDLKRLGVLYILSETNDQVRLCYMGMIEHYDEHGEPLCQSKKL